MIPATEIFRMFHNRTYSQVDMITSFASRQSRRRLDDASVVRLAPVCNYNFERRGHSIHSVSM